MNYHVPVLLEKVIDDLQIAPGGMYVDCTLGGGGHFREMRKLVQHGVLIGIDADEDAIRTVKQELLQFGFLETYTQDAYWMGEKEKVKIILVHENFKHIGAVMEEVGKNVLCNTVRAQGILFDLGVSSYQLDEPAKGFSYVHNSLLDMRMDQRLSVTAEDLVNGMHEKELVDMLQTYGEEMFAFRIAKNIVKARKASRITTSKQLCEVIKESVPFSYRHPYAKTFQALRIAVNDEIGNLQIAIRSVDDILANGGRLVFISFHSLEDRIVKQAYAANEKYRIVSLLVKPEEKEKAINQRARSAKLRSYEKISD